MKKPTKDCSKKGLRKHLEKEPDEQQSISDENLYKTIIESGLKDDIRAYLMRLRYDNRQLEKYVQALEKENMNLLSRCNHLESRVLFLENKLTNLIPEH